ncbi:MAG: DUF429 domain-containing protein [Burkholderiaceae bacterium]
MPSIYGVDFTSAPRRAKPITVARLAASADGRFELTGVEALADWPAFDAFLARPGPWVAGFDMPFGLPRALVETLGWPLVWRDLMRHYGALDRSDIRATFAAYCDARPAGSKFAHRAADRPAGSSTSMKWVNPPVAWMLHAGVPRLIAAGVCIPGVDDDPALVDAGRIALEAYPGYLARSVTRASYKSDTRAMHTDARREQRIRIVDALVSGRHALSLAVMIADDLRDALIDEGSADRLDALLCAVEAAWAWRQHAAGDPRYGLPDGIDPLEGWIVGVPGVAA